MHAEHTVPSDGGQRQIGKGFVHGSEHCLHSSNIPWELSLQLVEESTLAIHLRHLMIPAKRDDLIRA
jgi:hypothetical protein